MLPPFFMFEQNLELLKNAAGYEKVEKKLESLVESALSIRGRSDPKKEWNDWTSSNYRRALTLPDFSVKNKEKMKELSEWSDGINLLDMSTLIDNHNDIHTAEFVLEHASFLQSLGIDPYDRVSVVGETTDHLVCLGTSNGISMQWLISLINPRKLTLLLNDWDDWISSFWDINWGILVAHFSEQDREINIMRVHSMEVIADNISNGSIVTDKGSSAQDDDFGELLQKNTLTTMT